jgi:predicted RNase H-like HicB family nuclease
MAEQRHPLSYYLELNYPYTVVPDEGSFFVRFPDLPNCMTQVDTPGDIAAMAEEIRTLWIETEYERGAMIPEPTTQSGFSGKFVVRVPKSLHKELAEAAKQEGASLNAYVTQLLSGRNISAQMEFRFRELEAQIAELSARLPESQHADKAPLAAPGRKSRHHLQVVYSKAVAV